VPRLVVASPVVDVKSEESAFGRWTSAHWAPPPSSQLFRVVERIWYFDGTMTFPKERVFPDGRPELVVMLDEPHRDGDDQRLPSFPAVCINGLRTRSSVVVAPRGRCRVLGIRFGPTGACRVLRGSMKALVDVTIDLRDALGRPAAELGERCNDAVESLRSSPPRAAIDAIRIAAEWTLRQVDDDTCVDPAVLWTARTISDARGGVAVDAIGSAIGLRRAALAQRFCDAVGITPKRFARIVRFHAALSLLGRQGSISDAATDLGYYDQAHMHRDFAEFAGMTPGAFVAANRYPGSPSLAES
jgi:AraC-like DNA-binding protein